MSLGACCIQGAIHEGTPTGTIKTIGGVEGNYVALPEGDYDKTKALLFLPDVFGVPLINSQLLADSFAKNGIPTYIVEYLNGDAIPADALNDGKFDLQAWFVNHTQEITHKPLRKVMAGLQEEGVKEFAATGYCFGGRYVVDLVIDRAIKVGVVAHPSLLKVPEDLQAIKDKASDIPFLWNTAKDDYMFNEEQQAALEDLFKGSDKYVQKSHKGCGHGFAVRGDMSDPLVKEGKEDAFNKTVEFVKANL